MRHARSPGDQILCSRIRADAHCDTLAYIRRCLRLLFRKVGIQAAIHDLCHLAQRKFAKCDQVAGFKEVRERAFGPFDRINIAATHSLL